MGLRPLEISQFFQRVDRIYTAESNIYKKDTASDVYSRPILTYKDGPRAEKVKVSESSRSVEL